MDQGEDKMTLLKDIASWILGDTSKRVVGQGSLRVEVGLVALGGTFCDLRITAQGLTGELSVTDHRLELDGEQTITVEQKLELTT
jgi:hypothetical protein